MLFKHLYVPFITEQYNDMLLLGKTNSVDRADQHAIEKNSKKLRFFIHYNRKLSEFSTAVNLSEINVLRLIPFFNQ